MTNPETNPAVPEANLNITPSAVNVKTCKLGSIWASEVAGVLRTMWGRPRVKKTPLKQLIEALDDPDYDPANPPEDYEYEPIPTEAEIIATMADSMSAEIDREILEQLSGQSTL